MRIQEQIEFKVWDKIDKYSDFDMTQKILERLYKRVPVIEGRSGYFLKLRHFIAKKLFEVYYEMAVLVDTESQEKT